MSKRVSNKGERGRKTYPRSKVSYGWRKLALFATHGKKQVLSGEYLDNGFSK